MERSLDDEQLMRLRDEALSSIGSVGSEASHEHRDLEDNVQVYCRFRPFLRFELTKEDKKTKCCVAFHKSGKNALLKHGVDKPMKYDFDRVFQPSATQGQIFEAVGVSLVQGATEGQDAVVVSCGAMQSGKTFLLLGSNSDWKETETVQPNDGLIIRCARAIFDYINDANEGDEFTIQISSLRIRDDGIDDQLKGEVYVGSVVDIAKLLDSFSTKDSETMCYCLKLTQTDSTTKQTKTSSICFFDLQMEDIASLETLIDYQENQSTNQSDKIVRAIQRTISGYYKLCLIGNCSPHTNTVEQTKNTMELISSSSLIDKQARFAMINEGDVSPVNSPQAKMIARNRSGSINANLLTLDSYRSALEKVKKEKKKLLLRMAVASFKESSLSHEIQVLKHESTVLKTERETMDAKIQAIAHNLQMMKSHQTEMKTTLRDTILQTQDKLVDDISLGLLDREKEFVSNLSEMNAKFRTLQVECERLSKEKEEIIIENKKLIGSLEKDIQERKAEYETLRQRAWSAEEQSYSASLQRREMESVLAMTKDEYEVAESQIKELENKIVLLNQEVERLRLCEDTSLAEQSRLKEDFAQLVTESREESSMFQERELSWTDEKNQFILKIESLGTKVEQLTTSTENKSLELAALNQNITNTIAERQEAERRWESLKESVNNLNHELQLKEETLVTVKQTLKEQMAHHETSKADWAREKEDLERQLFEETKNLKTQIQELSSATKNREQDLKNEIALLTEENLVVKEHLSALNNEVSAHQINGEKWKQEKEDLEKQISGLLTETKGKEAQWLDENSKMKSSLSVLEDQIEKYREAEQRWEERDALEDKITETSVQGNEEDSLVSLTDENLKLKDDLSAINYQLSEVTTEWNREKQDFTTEAMKHQEEERKWMEKVQMLEVQLQELSSTANHREEEMKKEILALTEEKLLIKAGWDENKQFLESQIQELRATVESKEELVVNTQNILSQKEKQGEWPVEKQELIEQIRTLSSDISLREEKFNSEITALKQHILVMEKELENRKSDLLKSFSQRALLEEAIDSSTEKNQDVLRKEERLTDILAEKSSHEETIQRLDLSLRHTEQIHNEQIQKLRLENDATIQQLNHSIQTLQDEKIQFQTRLEKKEQDTQEFKHQLEEALSNFEKLNDMMNDKELEMMRLSECSKEEIRELNNDNAQLQALVRESRQEIESLKENLEQLSHKDLSQNERAIRYQKEIERLKASCQESENTKAIMHQETLSAIRTAVQELENERDNLRTQLENERNDITRLKKELEVFSQREKDNIELQNEREAIYKEEIVSLRTTSQDLDYERIKLEKRLEEILRQELDLINQRDKSQNENAVVSQREIENLKTRVHEVQVERSELRTKVEELKLETESLREEIDRMKQREQAEIEAHQMKIASYHEEISQLTTSLQEMESKSRTKKNKKKSKATSEHARSDSTSTISILQQQQVLQQVQALVSHIERTKQEKNTMRIALDTKEQEFSILKKRIEQKDSIINLLYNQISIINSVKSDQAEKMQGELDQLMHVLNQSKKNLISTPRGGGSSHTNINTNNEKVLDHNNNEKEKEQKTHNDEHQMNNQPVNSSE